MNLGKMLKKLANNQIVMVLAAVVAIGALYAYSKGFNISLSGLFCIESVSSLHLGLFAEIFESSVQS